LPPRAVHLQVAVSRYISTTGNDSGNCQTVFGACRTLQYAVDRSQPGDTIKIAEGIYVGVGSRGGTLQMARVPVSVTIEGGYDPRNFNRPPNPTDYPVVLNPAGGGRALV